MRLICKHQSGVFVTCGVVTNWTSRLITKVLLYILLLLRARFYLLDLDFRFLRVYSQFNKYLVFYKENIIENIIYDKYNTIKWPRVGVIIKDDKMTLFYELLTLENVILTSRNDAGDAG